MKKIGIILVLIVILLTGCNQIGSITISFETNGANLIEDVIIDSSINFVLPDDPIKEGYTFLGWYLDNKTFDVEYSSLLLTSSLTLYAKWLEENVIGSITISFETNGGNNIESFQFEVGTSISKPTDPIKEGCEFAGWYSDIELTEVYEFNVMPSIDITLYADWGTIGLDYALINNSTEYTVSKGSATTLAEIQIPNRKNGKLVTAILEQGFYDCNNLVDIIIPKTIKAIGKEAFRNCKNLESINIPYGVLNIESGTFVSCNSLSNLVIPESVINIGKIAFGYCSSLEDLVIPKSVDSIGENILTGCYGLKALTIPFVGSNRDATAATALFGYIFGTISYPNSIITKQYYADAFIGNIIPNYVDTFVEYYIPFSLKNIRITDATKLEYGAFINCKLISDIVIENSLEKISDKVFFYCDALERVSLPACLESIGDLVFSKCSSLKDIIINPENQKYKFENEALYDILNSELLLVVRNYQGEFIIPSTITSIGVRAFTKCKNITKVVISSNINNIGEYAFIGCVSLSRLVIPISVETIGISIVAETSSSIVLYVEAMNKPEGWHLSWHSELPPHMPTTVVWGYTGE